MTAPWIAERALRALKMLRECDDGGMQSKAIAHELGCGDSTARVALKHLEALGLAGKAGGNGGHMVRWIDAPRVEALRERLRLAVIERFMAREQRSFHSAVRRLEQKREYTRRWCRQRRAEVIGYDEQEQK